MSDKTIEQILAEFYKAILEWVNAGTPIYTPHHFARTHGLCANLEAYLTFSDVDHARWSRIHDLQRLLLHRHYGYTSTPFNNKSGVPLYGNEALSGMLYSNPLRLAWIKERAAK